jgi:hypothetical protein
MPKIIEIIVVNKHIKTKTEPIKTISPPALTIRKTKKLIKAANISHLNHCFRKTFGTGFLQLIFDMAISKKAPLGHKFQHQYRPLKKDRIKKNAIIATTKYPSIGINKPPITIIGRNHIIIN